MARPYDLVATALAEQRDQLLARDYVRFAKLVERAQRGGKMDVARLQQDVEKAKERVEQRKALVPTELHYPEELPVVQAKAELLEAIRDHQVVVVCGETGSGKTTQLPKLCLELGRGTRGLIGHTQPRRLAARSVANRIAAELRGNLGDTVGYETRFDRRVSERSLVKLMTDGILLAELGRDHLLTSYDTIIIDEAHERSLNIDFLLGWLKRILVQRPDLKVIITSATLDPERLSRHFDGAPIKLVSGRTYPVEQRYRALPDDGDLEGGIANAIEELWRPTPKGDVLVFLPGEREIRDADRVLSGRFPRAEVLPLYSRLAAQAQDKVFSPGKQPRIVLATNVAETSVTVPGIRYVVDTGTARLNRFSPRSGVQQLQIEPVSQAAANQRAGRCGRLGPGICIRLYAEDDFAARPAFTDPEIKRANLAGVILSMIALGLGEVEDFPWVEAPDSRNVSDAYRLLQTLGALDDWRKLTPLGEELARLPLDPRVARIALAGRGKPQADAICVLAAAMSVQDPHEVPPDVQDAARSAHKSWQHPRSDFLTLLNLWQRWKTWSAESSNRQLRRVCREHYVNFLRMEEWEQVYRQLRDMLGVKGEPAVLKPQDLDGLYPALHEALLTGLIDHIGLKLPDKGEYQGPRNRRFRIHPGSVLGKKGPQWLMSAQLAQTSQLFARTNAAVEPEWLERIGAHLVKRNVLHPEWSSERGEVTATEHVSLLGLPLLTRQRNYGATNPVEARAIFIREALLHGEMSRKPSFLEQNLALIEEVQDKEARLRRPDLLANDEQLERFYLERLPDNVCTTRELKDWLRRDAQAQSRMRMQESDVLRPGADANVESQFPDHLDIGGARIALSYSHEPGEEHDGVTFHIPLAAVHTLPEEVFDWLVPGLRTAKLEGLIRTLPNALRRYCTPAAEFARALAERFEPLPPQPIVEAMTEALRSMTGAAITAESFQPDKLEPHLVPRLQLEDAQGKLLGTANSLASLQGRFAGQARQALNTAATRDDSLKQWKRDDLADWDFEKLPETVPMAGARAWPALQAEGGKSHLRLFESPEAAADAHRAGTRSLLLARMPERTRDLLKAVKSKLGLQLMSLKITPESVADALARRAADHVLLDTPIRDKAGFQQALEKRGAFSIEAYKRLDEVAAWLGTAAELRKRLDAAGNRWPAPLQDLRQQLASLFAEGFLDAIPEPQWLRVAVYLRAMTVRLDRLQNKPARDEELTRQVVPLASKLPGPFHPARWVLEEWRITLFAQELKAQGSPSAARIVTLVADTP
ncbi:ATP-dependent RNA helicase HrpA [Solimonas sp. K1W22B-7]|uniref:ATP-dependent RNA helicase HrpA n=1 Tax=Solimonas sp. K1W22B-7 TaxID=2303331 RepID=UPI000E32ED86|nr:ATP-dependent RNA helicase HrpA [Solimonas sp. K1W22B-7]AXQ27211.1 ATP-dependent RNA helicase HrpA [Solimonas sp. K1W22B-7]